MRTAIETVPMFLLILAGYTTVAGVVGLVIGYRLGRRDAKSLVQNLSEEHAEQADQRGTPASNSR